MTNMEECKSDPWEDIALSMVREIVEAKEGTVPTVARFSEIMNSAKVEMLEALRRLYRKGLISYHDSVNGVPMFGIREDGR